MRSPVTRLHGSSSSVVPADAVANERPRLAPAAPEIMAPDRNSARRSMRPFPAAGCSISLSRPLRWLPMCLMPHSLVTVASVNLLSVQHNRGDLVVRQRHGVSRDTAIEDMVAVLFKGLGTPSPLSISRSLFSL